MEKKAIIRICMLVLAALLFSAGIASASYAAAGNRADQRQPAGRAQMQQLGDATGNLHLMGANMQAEASSGTKTAVPGSIEGSGSAQDKESKGADSGATGSSVGSPAGSLGGSSGGGSGGDRAGNSSNGSDGIIPAEKTSGNSSPNSLSSSLPGALSNQSRQPGKPNRVSGQGNQQADDGDIPVTQANSRHSRVSTPGEGSKDSPAQDSQRVGQAQSGQAKTMIRNEFNFSWKQEIRESLLVKLEERRQSKPLNYHRIAKMIREAVKDDPLKAEAAEELVGMNPDFVDRFYQLVPQQQRMEQIEQIVRDKEKQDNGLEQQKLGLEKGAIEQYFRQNLSFDEIISLI